MHEFENYKRDKLTINIAWANVFGILILIPITLLFGLPYYLVWNQNLDVKDIIDNLGPQHGGIKILYFISVFVLGIVIHELIHGLTWSRFTKHGLKSIKFGVLWKMLTPYCHCKEALKVKHYILGAITPAIILGFIPSIVAIMIGNAGLLIFGMFFTMAAGGDFLTINLIRKESMDNLVQDHPSEAGCYIYRKEKSKGTYSGL